MKTKIILATHNLGKKREFEHLFENFDFELTSSVEMNISDVEETGQTFVENAIIKARHAAKISGLPSIADDSGLCVTSLNNQPGIYSARYAGDHGNNEKNIDLLLKNLKPFKDRRAFFKAVLVFMKHAEDPDPIIASAKWAGVIAEEPLGVKGHGYDPIFIPLGYHQTASEMDLNLKNQISHRAIAFKKLIELLK